jgi:photosystem II stability/assembly factor-like uncharacterized protein
MYRNGRTHSPKRHSSYPIAVRFPRKADTSARWLILLLIATLCLLMVMSGPGLLAQEEEAAEGPTAPSQNPVISLAVAPDNPAGVLAGTLNTPELSTIFRSFDGGATWVRAGEGLRTDISIADIVYDPNNANLVLAADGGFGYLFRSTDGGSTWAEVPAFKDLIGPNSAVGELYAVTIDNVSLFYAGTRFDGVLFSTDGGQTWQSLATGLAGDARRVRSFQSFNGVMYVGTHDGVYSLDGATATWVKNATFPPATIAYSMAEQGGSLFVGTINSGLWRTEDGETWTQVLGFPAQASIYDLVSAGTGLVAATDVGVWSGSGEQWLNASVDSLPNDNPIYALTATDGIVFAGSAFDWVLRTDDRGFSFSSVATISPLVGTAPPVVVDPTAEPTAEPGAEPVAETTPDETLEIDVPGAPAEGTVVAEEPVDAPAAQVPTDTPVPPTATPVPDTSTTDPVAPTDTPVEAPTATAAPEAAPEAAGEDDGSSIVQLPPVVVGAAVLLLLVILVAGFSVLRGPRDV